MTKNKLIAINAIDLQDEEFFAVLGIINRLPSSELLKTLLEEYQIWEMYHEQL